MAKVVVIDVDFGFDIDKIISESAQELTTNAKNELDGAISAAKSVQEIKNQKIAAKEQSVNNIQISMEKAYDALKSARGSGVAVQTIMDLVSPHIPNSSAFMLRMKKMLSAKDNPYRLVRATIEGVPHYIFTSYNQDITKDN